MILMFNIPIILSHPSYSSFSHGYSQLLSLPHLPQSPHPSPQNPDLLFLLVDHPLRMLRPPLTPWPWENWERNETNNGGTLN